MKPNTVIVGWPNSWRKAEDDGTKVFVDTIRSENWRKDYQGYWFHAFIFFLKFSITYRILNVREIGL